MRMTLTVKLIAPWFIFILLSAAGLFVYSSYINRLDSELDIQNQRHARAVEITKDILLLTQDRWVIVLKHASQPNKDSAASIVESGKRIEELSQKLQDMFDPRMNAEVRDDGWRDESVLSTFLISRDGLTQSYIELLGALDSANAQQEKQAIAKVVRKMRTVRAALNDLMQFNIISRNMALNNAKQMEERARNILFYSIGLILLALLVFTAYQAIDLVRPMQQVIAKVAHFDVEKSELNLESAINRTDEVGELARSFDHMAVQIKSYIKQLSERQTLILEHMGKMSKVGGGSLI